jgi:hypothetical protein
VEALQEPAMSPTTPAQNLPSTTVNPSSHEGRAPLGGSRVSHVGPQVHPQAGLAERAREEPLGGSARPPRGRDRGRQLPRLVDAGPGTGDGAMVGWGRRERQESHQMGSRAERPVTATWRPLGPAGQAARALCRVEREREREREMERAWASSAWTGPLPPPTGRQTTSLAHCPSHGLP